MASLELLRFKETVGPQNWRLFSGETVRNNNSVGSIIPEPLTLAIGLKDWNPRSGIIPSSTSAVAIVQSKIGNQYTTDIRGEIEEGKRQQVENYLGGLLQRQEAMLAYLEIARGPDDPKLPLRKSIEGLLKDASDGADFAYTLSLFRENCLPRKYQRLSLADRKLLGLLRWEKLHKEKLRNLRELRQKSRKDMIKMYSTQVAKMRARADRHEQHRKALMLGRDKFLGDRATWNEKKILAAMRPPTVNEIPAPPERRSTGSSYSSSGDSGGYGGERHAPTIDIRPPNWDGR
jgi:hypothetical protein